MKTCTKCLRELPVEEFHKKLGGVQSTCRQCVKRYGKERYSRRKEEALQANYNNRKELAKFVDSLKNYPCLDCGMTYESFCMDFDHLRDKTAAVAIMVHNTHSRERILEEIAKTELVCVLCHKNRTKQRVQAGSRSGKLGDSYARNRGIYDEARSVPCLDCGKSYNPWQMEFDHRGDKTAHVSVLAITGASEKRLREEIAKCDVRCALCHRRKTFAERGCKR